MCKTREKQALFELATKQSKGRTSQIEQKRCLALMNIVFMLLLCPGVCAQTVSVGNSTPKTSPLPASITTTSAQALQGSVNQNHALNVASGQSLVIDFGKSSSVSISGNLSNSGTIYLLSSNPQQAQASVFANNIINAPGGLITSVIPSSLLASLHLPAANLSYSLIAVHDIINSGAITSAANLNLVAGGSISNLLPASGVAPVIQSQQNLNLIASQINNAGLLASSQGSINVNNTALTSSFQQIISNDLIINNIGGVIQALNGSFNVRDSEFLANQNLAVLGGQVSAQQVNLFSGTGNVVFDLDSARGPVSVSAGEAHLTVSSGTLNLGNMNINGDPTFYNMGGDVIIDTALDTKGASLAIVASGNIFSVQNIGTGSKASSITTSGGDISVVAGVSFTSNGGPQTTNPFAPVTLSITGPSVSGGRIDFSGQANPDLNPVLYKPAAITTFSSAASSNNANGGNVDLLAFSGSALNSGNINLPPALTILTGGNGSGNNGNVLVHTPGGALNLGNIDTRGGSGSGGTITVVAGQAQGASGASGLIGSASVQNSQITDSFILSSPVGALFTNSGTPNSVLGGSLVAGDLFTPGKAVSISTNTFLVNNIHCDGGAGNNNGGSINLVSRNPIQIGAGSTNGVSGQITAYGGATGGNAGSVVVNADNTNVTDDFPSAGVTTDLSSFGLSASAGNGGNLTLLGGSVNLGGTLNLNGGGNGSGGTFNVNGGMPVNISSPVTVQANGAGAGNGGAINIGGTVTLYQYVLLFSFPHHYVSVLNNPSTVSLHADGGTSGNGGSITLFEGNSINLGSSSLTASANGGSAGSLTGNGGAISVTANNNSSNINISSVALSAAPLGNNGNGGSLILMLRTISILQWVP